MQSIKHNSVLFALFCCLISEPAFSETNQWSFQIDSSAKGAVTSLLQNVSTFLDRAEKEEVTVEQTRLLEQQLSAWVNLRLNHAMKSQKKLSASLRQSTCKAILTQPNHARLEKYFLGQLPSNDPSEIAAALIILGRGLFSLQAKDPIKQLFRKSLENLEDSDPSNDPTPEVIFSAAEALCYLDDLSGLEVLRSAVCSKTASPSLQRRAMLAIANTDDDTLIIDTAKGNLQAEDPGVAYGAFDILESRLQEKKILYDAAYTQLGNLTASLQAKGKLNHNEKVLLGKVSLILRLGLRSKVFSQTDVEVIRNNAKLCIASGSEEELEKIASLFAEVAKDEDAGMIGNLLKADSSVLKAKGALAVAHRSRKVQEQFLPQLLAMLDHDNKSVRNFALYAIRTYKGEKAGNYLSEREFEKQRKRIEKDFQTPQRPE